MKSSNLRAHLLFSLLAIGFAFVLLRSVQLQISPNPRLKALATQKQRWATQVQTEEKITSRGAIVDRQGKDLALSLVVKSFFANPKQIKDAKGTAAKLAPFLGMSPVKIRGLLRQDRYFVWLKREVDEANSKRIESLNLDGIYSRKETKRIYPHGDLARSVLGVSGHDGIGLEGIEKTYDAYLKSSDSLQGRGIRDALGRLLLYEDFKSEWFKGHEVISTLDLRLQKIVEDELRATVNEKDAISGQAIMIDPKNGEILAMASIDGRRAERNPLRNRAISDVYEPGSTFKVLLAAAALKDLKMTAHSQIYGEEGSFRVGSNTIKEYRGHKYGWISLQELLELSSNIAAAKVGLKIGAKDFEEIIRTFGIGETTGIDLPGEAMGLLRSGGSWRPIDLATISFGQGVAVTPVQLARAISVVANGGILVQPHLVSKIVRANSKNEEEVVWKPNLKAEEIYPPELARALTDMLIHVTEKGSTGVEAAIEGYKVAGKTGTSQKLIEKEIRKGKKVKTYTADHSIVSFGGYVPAYDPAFVLLVVYDDPLGRVSGGNTAAPSFRRIASRSIAVMGLPPDRGELPPLSIASVKNAENERFIGKSFQEVLREVKGMNADERAKVDLIGYGVAVREEFDSDEQRLKVYFK